ncbi:MAG: DMT family transporter [Anaerolineales bacterium]|nr:DMT family transporter [Anaerolineales bacterium]
MPNSLLYLITLLIWGSTWLAIKYQLGVVAPEWSVAYRFSLSALLLMIIALVRRSKLRFPLRAHAFIAAQGFFLFSLNYILIYYAEQHLSSGLVAIIFSLIVVTNTLFGAIFLKSRIRWQVLAGGVIGILGLGLVFWPELRTFSLTSNRALGLSLALGGTVSASLGNIISARNQQHDLPIIQTNMYGMAYGAAFMILLALIRSAPLEFEWSPGYTLSLLYLSLFGSVIAFGSYLTLLGRIGPDRSAYVTVLFPIVALSLSTIFEGLTWNLLAVAGVMLVIAGNALALMRRRKPSKKPEPADNRA